MSAPRLYHLGFVTADLDAAQEQLAARFGIERFRVRRDPLHVSQAHAFAGDILVEISQPGPEAPAIYLDNLPADGLVRLHHLGYLIPDVEGWAEIVGRAEREAWNVPLRGESKDGHLRFLFVDARADLGFFQEYVCLTGPELRRYEDVPVS